MAKKVITISSIYEGIQPSLLFGKADQYLAGIAIDPDLPISDASTEFKPAGIIRPAGYAKISSTGLADGPMFILAAPVFSEVYAYDQSGNLLSYDNNNGVLSNETLKRAVSASAGNGLAFYDGYLFYGLNTKIGRYDLSSTFVDDYFGSLGFNLVNNGNLVGSRDGMFYPGHVMHPHVDNKLYILDGQYVHYIKLDASGADAGTAFKVLTLPFGYRAFDIKSYGNNVVIAASTAASANPAISALFFWDTTSPSFNTFVRIPDKICTALVYMNGTLYIWSGASDTVNGYTRFSKYLGGDSIQTIAVIEDSIPPSSGAVVGDGNRLMWGGHCIYPTPAAGVYAYGTKSGLFPAGLHFIARASIAADATNGHVSALATIYQTQRSFPVIAMGSFNTNAGTPAIDTKSTTYQTSVFRSAMFNVGQDFTVSKITLPLAQAMGANMTIVPKLFFDHGSTSQVGTTLNATNYPNSEKIIRLDADNFLGNSSGKINFFLELTISGTALSAVSLPIEIEIDVDEDI